MNNKHLICTKCLTTTAGKTLHLEYYLLTRAVMDGCADSYGVEITARSPDEEESAAAHDITMTGTRILELIELLAAGTVTPTTLHDVVQDWL